MKVKKIVPGKFKKQYLTIYMDGDYFLKLHEEIIAKYQIREGLNLDDRKLGEIKSAGEAKEALEYATLFLSYRARSEKEMTERLKRKGFPTEAVIAAIRTLKEQRLIDDAQYAREFAESRLKKHLGTERIQQELDEKGIHKDRLDEVLKDIGETLPDGLKDEDERAYHALIKRRKQLKETDYRALHRRLYGYLARKGFSLDTIEKALQRCKREERFGEQED